MDENPWLPISTNCKNTTLYCWWRYLNKQQKDKRKKLNNIQEPLKLQLIIERIQSKSNCSVSTKQHIATWTCWIIFIITIIWFMNQITKQLGRSKFSHHVLQPDHYLLFYNIWRHQSNSNSLQKTVTESWESTNSKNLKTNISKIIKTEIQKQKQTQWTNNFKK